ncbi:hypothetical protein MTO96_000411 [Rhipicephalus appendiculatus]
MGKKAKSKGAKPKAASQPTKSAATTLTPGQPRADGPTMSQTQEVLQDFFKDDEDKLASYGVRIAREQQKHQLEQQAIAVIGDWLVKTTTRSSSQPPPISRIIAIANANLGGSEWATASANNTLENAASVALRASSEDEDMDVAVASRKRARDDDESECPRKQAQTGCAPTPSPSDPGTPRDTTGTPTHWAKLLAGTTADPGPLRPTPAPRRSLLPPASSSRTSPPAAPPAEPAEDPRDALIATLLAALRAVGEYLPSDHPMRSVCLQAASAESGATTVD